jgi:redox-sensitive bicupin YhaK (pirin superfamily)
MQWAHLVPTIKTDGVVARVWAGTINGTTALDPCCNSWAMDPANEVGIWHIKVDPGKTFALPVTSADVNRNIYYIEGAAAEIGGRPFAAERVIVTTAGGAKIVLAVPADAPSPSEFLVLQGKPIGEPVAQYVFPSGCFFVCWFV